MSQYFDKTILQDDPLWRQMVGYWDGDFYPQSPGAYRNLLNDKGVTIGATPDLRTNRRVGNGLNFVAASTEWMDTDVLVDNVDKLAHTISLWIRPGVMNGNIVDSMTTLNNKMFQVWVNASGVVHGHVRSAFNAAHVWDTALANGRLDHIAMTWAAGDSVTVSYYMNGKPDGTASSGTLSTGANEIKFAARSYDNGFPLNCELYKMRFWERKLSAVEIRQVYERDLERTFRRRIVVRAPAGQTVAVGIATETDTAFAVGKAKVQAMGLASETDTAFGVTRIKSQALGLASETDTAFAVGKAKSKAVGIASETDTAFSVTATGAIAVGIATETDTAFAVTAVKSKSLGIAAETDTAFAVGKAKTQSIGIAPETDTAFGVASTKVKELGLASETDSAFSVTPVTPGEVVVGIAIETDTAFPVVSSKLKAVGLAAETDSAFVVTANRSRTISVGIATETDNGLAVGKAKAKSLGIATEIDTAIGVTVGGLLTVGIAAETDIALPAYPVLVPTPTATHYPNLIEVHSRTLYASRTRRTAKALSESELMPT